LVLMLSLSIMKKKLQFSKRAHIPIEWFNAIAHGIISIELSGDIEVDAVIVELFVFEVVVNYMNKEVKNEIFSIGDIPKNWSSLRSLCSSRNIQRNSISSCRYLI